MTPHHHTSKAKGPSLAPVKETLPSPIQSLVLLCPLHLALSPAVNLVPAVAHIHCRHASAPDADPRLKPILLHHVEFILLAQVQTFLGRKLEDERVETFRLLGIPLWIVLPTVFLSVSFLVGEGCRDCLLICFRTVVDNSREEDEDEE